jgi:hypothetical protein
MLMRPDGQLHVETLRLGQGQAVFVRGPSGRNALVVLGRADAIALVNQVADHLLLWEHRLDDVVALDASAEASLGVTLARYPAGELIRGAATLDLGGGQTLSASALDGRIAIQSLRSGLTTFGARPG